MTIFKIPFLLLVKKWTLWCLEHLISFYAIKYRSYNCYKSYKWCSFLPNPVVQIHRLTFEGTSIKGGYRVKIDRGTTDYQAMQ